MSKKAPDLEPQHWRYIQLRLLGYTNPDVAREMDVDPVTAWRWGQVPQVREELAKMQADVSESAVRLLRANAVKAAKTIAELMDSEDDGVRLRAAMATLERLPVVPEDVPLREVAGTGDPWDSE